MLRPMALAALALVSLANLQAEPPTHAGPPAPPDGRRIAADAMNRRVLDMAVEKFGWDKDEFAARNGAILQTALTEAANPSDVKEIPVASVVADLFGTVNNTQLKEAFTKAKADKVELEAKKDLTGSDKEYLTFLDRILWAGRLVRLGLPGFEMLDDVKTEPAAKFKAFEEAFQKAFPLVLKSNEEFHALVDKINKTTDPKERADLQKQLNERFASTTKFLDGQVATSEADDTGAKVAQAVAQAIAQKNAQGHDLDLVGTGDTPIRIPLPKEPEKIPATLRDARKNFAPLKDGGFAKTRPAAKPHTGGGVQTFGGGRGGGGGGENNDVKKPFDATLKKLMVDQGCVDCHSAADDDPKFFTADGDILPGKTAKRLIEVLDGCNAKGVMSGKAKKFRAEMNKDEASKKAYTDWANANGFEVDFSAVERDEKYCEKWKGEGPVKKKDGSGKSAKVDTTELDKKVAHLANDACVLCHGKNSDMPYFEEDGAPLKGKGMSPKKFAKILEGCGLESDGTMISEIPKVRKALKDDERATLIAWAKAHNLPLDLAGAFPPSKDACKKWNS